MAQEKLNQAAEKTMAIVRSIAGHPDVSVEEAGEILLLAGQRLEAARSLSGLNQFSQLEIDGARQFIDSLEPAIGSRAEGFQTVQSVLDFYQQLVTFNSGNEVLVEKILKGKNISYYEPDSIKVGNYLHSLGYAATTFYLNVGTPIEWYGDELQNYHLLQIGIPRLPEQKVKKIFFGFLNDRTGVHKQTREYIGTLDLKYESKWVFWARNHQTVASAAIVATKLNEQFNRKIQITLIAN